ncbi:MAG: hypothetical protein NZ529_05850 [Cytophagaceae bacterium]|nr:hypothetical protein [Cytophagaceae bacterium]MDW8456301.1 hypothetical protein [Cytophagaceae bacterium]
MKEINIDHQKTESYSIALSEKLCNEFYQGTVLTISGQQILKFTPIEQVNLFVVKNLFEKWKDETSKIRSPYFDYENEEVKEALQSFLNKLSKHISIRKEFFKPLLKKSIYDTWMYVFNPHKFISIDCLSKPVIVINELCEKERYFKINKSLFQALIKKLQLQNKPALPQEEAQKIFDDVYKNFEPLLEPASKYVEAFSALLKIQPQDLLISHETPEKNDFVSEPVSENILQNKIAGQSHTYLKKEATREKTVNDLFAQNHYQTINDLMQKNEPETILASHKKTKIHELKTAVPLNLKYIFINELFGGNSDDYNLAISQLDRCADYDSAKNIIEQIYAKKYLWDVDKSETMEFMELVERRFYK